ncbi:CvpA family protein [Ketobacter sp. MCCC 1A13808]|uniref:CvpA family protein n=1 Tax=Ketobacter sp. MCCC 1A13808 TaxID=2602738 RepID=UPI000F12772F|nr:CvpA family protein [Ketobacter sp. MCCC 1A13808]MVF12458.1 CvpA family protein [Ketobacter sp. MCCC 1A13808]RLP55731.1 MAG: CvpA family protein [Ketobacter sp.]
MSIADYLIIGCILISMALSLHRGFTVEALSLATWVAAFIVARLFSVPLAVVFSQWIELPSARQPIAFILLFVATLIVGALIKHLVKHLVQATGLSGTDRVLGSVFGLLRGSLLVVIALAVLSRMTQMPLDPWWKQSILIPHFLMVEEWTAEMGQLLWHNLMGISAK